MVFKQVLKRNEYLSECGQYKVVESKCPGYWRPMKKSGKNGTSFISLLGLMMQKILVSMVNNC